MVFHRELMVSTPNFESIIKYTIKIMNKNYLLTKIKSTGTAYVCWFFFGAHYLYLGKWGLQFLYWFTLGGLGIWCVIDLFLIPSKVDKYNLLITQQIEDIEKKEKEESFNKTMAIISSNK